MYGNRVCTLTKSPYSRGFPYSRSIAEVRISHTQPDFLHSPVWIRPALMACLNVEASKPHFWAASLNVIHSSISFPPLLNSKRSPRFRGVSLLLFINFFFFYVTLCNNIQGVFRVHNCQDPDGIGPSRPITAFDFPRCYWRPLYPCPILAA